MAYELPLTPAAKGRSHEPWSFIVDFDLGTCVILNTETGVKDEFSIVDVPSRITLPDFAGTHKWPRFRLPYQEIEFKMGKESLRFLHELETMAMITYDRKLLGRLKRRFRLLIAAGFLLLITVVPLCIRAFLLLDSDEDLAGKVFGLICAVSISGLMLIINSARETGKIKKALRLKERAGL